MFFLPDIWFWPTVKNIPSVIHWCEAFFQHAVDALLNPKVLIDRPVSLRSTSFELQAREGLYEDKKNDCQLDDRRRHTVRQNTKIPPEIKTTKLKSILFS